MSTTTLTPEWASVLEEQYLSRSAPPGPQPSRPYSPMVISVYVVSSVRVMSRDELAVTWKLRRVLSALDGQAALELLINKLKETKTNIEFLLQVNKTTPTAGGSRRTDDGD